MNHVRSVLSNAAGRLRGRRHAGSDRGFTLVEVVVVVAILPLVIGAAAAVIIYTERNSNQTSARLSDSVNAQLTAANYVRDVQGATQLTTDPTPATGPAVCGNGSLFLLGLNRTGTLSVGYWEVHLTTPTSSYEVVRFSCGVPASQVVVADSVNNLTQTPAVVVPSSFGNPATGWIPTSATTTVPTSKALSGTNDTIALSSTVGFTIGTVALPQPLTFLADLATPNGPFAQETVSCTGGTATSFTGCNGGSGTIDASTVATQPAAVDSVHLTMMEIASSYTFGLRSTPRQLCALTGGNATGVPGAAAGGDCGGSVGNANGGPALLTLKSGVSIQGGAGSSLTVDGIADISAGTLGCTGSPTVTANSYEATGGSSVIGSCASGGPTTQLSEPTPDPLLAAGAIPIPFPSSWLGEGTGSTGYAGGPCPSGVWNIALPSGCQLQPGLFVLNAGYCTNGSNLAMASGSGANGVLLYIPPGATTCGGGASNNCTGTSVHDSFHMGGNATLSVPPLTAGQANTIFGSPGMAGVVLWQDSGNQNNLSLGGTPAGVAPGTLYAPSALLSLQGNGAGTFGQIIASCISIAGSTPLIVTGQ